MTAEPIEPTTLYDADGNRFLVEHAGVWDHDSRSGVFYEDEEIPDDATPLYWVRRALEPVADKPCGTSHWFRIEPGGGDHE